MSSNLQWSRLGESSVVADSAGNSAMVRRQQPFLGQTPPAPKFVVSAGTDAPLEFWLERDAMVAAEALVRGESPPADEGVGVQWSALSADSSVVVNRAGKWAFITRQGPYLGQNPPVPKFVLATDGEEPREFFIEAEARDAAESSVRAAD